MLNHLTKWKPDWLYKIMPIIYFVAGLAVILIVDSPPGLGAGAVLLLAACLIWMMRNQKRT